MQNIIITTIKEWNIENYFKIKEQYKEEFNFHLITNKEELTLETVHTLEPKYIFFPHWSWVIPKKIYDNFNCVVFHMTDLPYGRGGSPFQNLIMNEVYDTKISALKVEDGLDTGDIYLKEDCNISIGSAQENFIKISKIVFEKMIPSFLENDLKPQKQSGKITQFKRRKPEDSNILKLENKSISKLYDFIRMLDAEGYPKAYMELENIKIEFSQVHQKDKKLTGRFEMIENE
ncbi:formyltransferase family protein [Poseidonibacter antarcticus]|uniref:formyltransferase family protein n=1 Tax=Poseidonibacter antarcticus TaxID=2478538 RepID=UPI000EF4896B|nr:formyltransferase family protein [Poseidonibacter antarcticus]